MIHISGDTMTPQNCWTAAQGEVNKEIDSKVCISNVEKLLTFCKLIANVYNIKLYYIIYTNINTNISNYKIGKN